MKGRRQKAEGRREKTGARSARSSFILHPSSFAICVALAAGFGGAGGAWAQIASDPTRAPGGFATGEPEVGADAGPVLQSVMISPTRKAAIISGTLVRLGEKYGDAVLVKVAENEVVLKSDETIQVLKMYPGVEKREEAPVAKGAPRRTKTTRSGSDPAATGSAATR